KSKTKKSSRKNLSSKFSTLSSGYLGVELDNDVENMEKEFIKRYNTAALNIEWGNLEVADDQIQELSRIDQDNPQILYIK
ncbi:MAG: hypothetical protein MHPSP_004535, partial [Paramarteilia canceri]